MSCEECDKAEEIDGAIPDCRTEKGCLIPPLSETGARIMQVREKLMKLKDLVDPATILRMHGVTLDDLDLLAAVEEMLGTPKKEKEDDV